MKKYRGEKSRDTAPLRKAPAKSILKIKQYENVMPMAISRVQPVSITDTQYLVEYSQSVSQILNI